jgi:multicomponent Na+:H+ antiporter subunit A
MIETLTVVLLVLVFYHLPRFARLSTAPTHARDIIVALAAGAMVSVFVLVAIGTQYESPISAYFMENSLPLAHGRNVVNVILVDFRALDTLGEMTVLALAGLGVYALLKLRPAKREDE